MIEDLTKVAWIRRGPDTISAIAANGHGNARTGARTKATNTLIGANNMSLTPLEITTNIVVAAIQKCPESANYINNPEKLTNAFTVVFEAVNALADKRESSFSNLDPTKPISTR